jgi:hypothetical protein
MALELELETFNEMKEHLLQAHEGKFALIKGREFIGAYDTPENAYREGIGKFGREPFLVKRISQSEETYRNQALFLGLMHAHI